MHPPILNDVNIGVVCRASEEWLEPLVHFAIGLSLLHLFIFNFLVLAVLNLEVQLTRRLLPQLIQILVHLVPDLCNSDICTNRQKELDRPLRQVVREVLDAKAGANVRDRQ